MGFTDDFWMGPGTLKINSLLFKENRSRLLIKIREQCIHNPVVLLQGGRTVPVNDTDIDYLFRQETYFYWTFGILEPGAYGVLDVNSGKAIGFFERQDEEFATWMGPIHDLQFYKCKYDLDDVGYTDQLECFLEQMCNITLLLLSGQNSDSGLQALEACFAGIWKFRLNKAVLYKEISDLRTVKNLYEIEVMRYVCHVSSEGHKAVMKMIKPGMYQYQIEAEFLKHVYKHGGCRHVGYSCICGTGLQSAILHYGYSNAPNDNVINDGDMCLFDMGAEYFGYTADITCSFPVNGYFNADQRMIYEAVLEANWAVKAQAKPGASWRCMHLLANRILLENLKKGGLLCGEVEEMMSVDLAYTFQPHGLGHLLGLQVHDVGGYIEGTPPRESTQSLSKLRTCRTLVKGMIMTIEPGCYFIEHLLNKAMQDSKLSKFLVQCNIDRFRCFGGVRIEDDVLITDCGAEVLNKVPRTVREIEEWMAGCSGGCS